MTYRMWQWPQVNRPSASQPRCGRPPNAHQQEENPQSRRACPQLWGSSEGSEMKLVELAEGYNINQHVVCSRSFWARNPPFLEWKCTPSRRLCLGVSDHRVPGDSRGKCHRMPQGFPRRSHKGWAAGHPTQSWERDGTPLGLEPKPGTEKAWGP